TSAVEALAVEIPVIENSVIAASNLETPVVEAPEVQTPAVESREVETPVTKAPIVADPAVKTPAVEDSTPKDLALEESAPEALAAEAPIVEIPAIEGPDIEPPAVEAHDVEASAVEDPVIEVPVVETHVIEAPAVETSAVEAPITETSAVEGSAIEDPAVDNFAAENPAVEDPAVKGSKVDTPAVEGSAIEAPAVEAPVVEVPAIEDPVVEIPAVEVPVAEAPAVEASVETPAVEASVDTPDVEASVETPGVEAPDVEASAAEDLAVDASAVDQPDALPTTKEVAMPAVDSETVDTSSKPTIESAIAEPVSVETGLEEQKADEHVVDLPAVEESVVSIRDAEEPAASDPVSEDGDNGKSVSTNPADQVPTTDNIPPSVTEKDDIEPAESAIEDSYVLVESEEQQSSEAKESSDRDLDAATTDVADAPVGGVIASPDVEGANASESDSGVKELEEPISSDSALVSEEPATLPAADGENVEASDTAVTEQDVVAKNVEVSAPTEPVDSQAASASSADLEAPEEESSSAVPGSDAGDCAEAENVDSPALLEEQSQRALDADKLTAAGIDTDESVDIPESGEKSTVTGVAAEVAPVLDVADAASTSPDDVSTDVVDSNNAAVVDDGSKATTTFTTDKDDVFAPEPIPVELSSVDVNIAERVISKEAVVPPADTEGDFLGNKPTSAIEPTAVASADTDDTVPETEHAVDSAPQAAVVDIPVSETVSDGDEAQVAQVPVAEETSLDADPTTEDQDVESTPANIPSVPDLAVTKESASISDERESTNSKQIDSEDMTTVDAIAEINAEPANESTVVAEPEVTPTEVTDVAEPKAAKQSTDESTVDVLPVEEPVFQESAVEVADLDKPVDTATSVSEIPEESTAADILSKPMESVIVDSNEDAVSQPLPADSEQGEDSTRSLDQDVVIEQKPTTTSALLSEDLVASVEDLNADQGIEIITAEFDSDVLSEQAVATTEESAVDGPSTDQSSAELTSEEPAVVERSIVEESATSDVPPDTSIDKEVEITEEPLSAEPTAEEEAAQPLSSSIDDVAADVTAVDPVTKAPNAVRSETEDAVVLDVASSGPAVDTFSAEPAVPTESSIVGSSISEADRTLEKQILVEPLAVNSQIVEEQEIVDNVPETVETVEASPVESNIADTNDPSKADLVTLQASEGIVDNVTTSALEEIDSVADQNDIEPATAVGEPEVDSVKKEPLSAESEPATPIVADSPMFKDNLDPSADILSSDVVDSISKPSEEPKPESDKSTEQVSELENDAQTRSLVEDISEPVATEVVSLSEPATEKAEDSFNAADQTSTAPSNSEESPAQKQVAVDAPEASADPVDFTSVADPTHVPALASAQEASELFAKEHPVDAVKVSEPPQETGKADSVVPSSEESGPVETDKSAISEELAAADLVNEKLPSDEPEAESSALEVTEEVQPNVTFDSAPSFSAASEEHSESVERQSDPLEEIVSANQTADATLTKDDLDSQKILDPTTDSVADSVSVDDGEPQIINVVDDVSKETISEKDVSKSAPAEEQENTADSSAEPLVVDSAKDDEQDSLSLLPEEQLAADGFDSFTISKEQTVESADQLTDTLVVRENAVTPDHVVEEAVAEPISEPVLEEPHESVQNIAVEEPTKDSNVGESIEDPVSEEVHTDDSSTARELVLPEANAAIDEPRSDSRQIEEPLPTDSITDNSIDASIPEADEPIESVLEPVATEEESSSRDITLMTSSVEATHSVEPTPVNEEHSPKEEDVAIEPVAVQDKVLDSEPVAESVVKSADTSAVESTAELLQEPSAEAAVEQAVKLVAEPAVESAVEPTVEPSPELIAEPVIKRAAALAAESTAEPVKESAVEPAVEQTIEEVVEPAVESIVESAVEPAVESAVDLVAEPTVESAVESAVESLSEPIAESDVERAIAPSVEPTVQPAEKLSAEQTTESVVEPVVDTVVESPADPVAKPTVEPTAELTIEPAVESIAEPAVEQVMEPAVEPIMEPAVEVAKKPAVEPNVESVVESASEPAVEPVVELVVEPVVEPVAEQPEEPTGELHSKLSSRSVAEAITQSEVDAIEPIVEPATVSVQETVADATASFDSVQVIDDLPESLVPAIEEPGVTHKPIAKEEPQVVPPNVEEPVEPAAIEPVADSELAKSIESANALADKKQTESTLEDTALISDKPDVVEEQPSVSAAFPVEPPTASVAISGLEPVAEETESSPNLPKDAKPEPFDEAPVVLKEPVLDAVKEQGADTSTPPVSVDKPVDNDSAPDQRSYDEVDSVMYPSVSRRSASTRPPRLDIAEHQASETELATDQQYSAAATPSYVMHYPESLFGDTASITPGLITIEDLHAAQKASAVVGVSTVSATTVGRRSRDSGFHGGDGGEYTVGQRMKRFISGKRSESPRGRASSDLDSRDAPTSPRSIASGILAETRDKLGPSHRASRGSHESKRPSGAPSSSALGGDDDDELKHASPSIPGSFPSAQASGRFSESETTARIDPDASLDESPLSSEGEGTGKDKHRRHTILGVIKRIFR
ncbi:hypothetical protein H4217_006982, partial [Coemansia sp. RSA 1939]